MFGTNEKYMARIMLKNKILSADAQTFETLFTLIMQKVNCNFEQVKPYGNIGDWKNDGFDKTTGTYYQVYAPEDIEKANTISNAQNKLKSDFEGLFAHWNSICPIKSFYFVINDKYKGIAPQIHATILQLEKTYTNIKIDLFLAKDLEDSFMQCSDDDMVSVVGCIANPADQLDFGALTEVINHLMNMRGEELSYDHLVVPDFEEKIRFNRLSDPIGCQLRTASYQVGGLERFFRNNSNYTKAQIQQKITTAYIDAANVIDEADEHYSDLVFLKLVDDIYPNGTAAIRNAIMILMAYFFESCDIFKRPPLEVSV